MTYCCILLDITCQGEWEEHMVLLKRDDWPNWPCCAEQGNCVIDWNGHQWKCLHDCIMSATYLGRIILYRFWWLFDQHLSRLQQRWKALVKTCWRTVVPNQHNQSGCNGDVTKHNLFPNTVNHSTVAKVKIGCLRLWTQAGGSVKRASACSYVLEPRIKPDALGSFFFS